VDLQVIRKWLTPWGAAGWFLAGLALATTLIGSIERVREKFLFLLSPPERVLLAVADNKLGSPSGLHQVNKIRTPQGIVVELLGSADSEGHRKLLEKVLLPDFNDAYFHLNTRATNLAIVDLDSDGEPEVLVPTYDQNGRPRLNTIKFDKQTNRFQLQE